MEGVLFFMTLSYFIEVKTMYYKVLKDGKVIDVLDKLIYLKYQPKHKIMVLTNENDAQAILSSNKNTIWHEKTLYKIPVDGYDTVEIFAIDKYEYEQLRVLNMRSPEEIFDSAILFLIENNIL
jgi:hypothetical protein